MKKNKNLSLSYLWPYIGGGRFFPWKAFYRLFLFQACIIFAVWLGASLSIRFFFKHQFIRQSKHQIESIILSLKNKNIVPEKICSEAFLEPDMVIFVFDEEKKQLICKNLSVAQYRFRPPFLSYELLATERGEILTKTFYISPHLRIDIESRLKGLHEILQALDAALIGASLLFVLILVFLSFWSAKKIVFPLGRLLIKTENFITKNELNHNFSEDYIDNNYFISDEWKDLESNINKLKEDLVTNKKSLTQGKIETDTLLKSINEAVVVLGNKGDVMLSNEAFKNYFKDNLEVSKNNVKIWEIFRQPDILSAFSKTLRKNITIQDAPIFYKNKIGDIKYFNLSVTPLFEQGEEGTLYCSGVVGVFHDISHLKLAERMRIDFVASVSHELRTPLTSIQGYVQTLLEDFKKPKKINTKEVVQFLQIIKRNSTRLMNIMKDLLDLSALEIVHKIEKEQCKVEFITKNVLHSLMPQINEKKQKVQTHWGKKYVSAHPIRIEQVLTNLITNASKYSNVGATISIAWLSKEDVDTKLLEKGMKEFNDGLKKEVSDKGVFLVVSDNGPGIKPEHQERIFERFYAIDESRSRDLGGTGLGLSIVKHIVKKHGGHVWVSSEGEVGKGSSFICFFPS